MNFGWSQGRFTPTFQPKTTPASNATFILGQVNNFPAAGSRWVLRAGRIWEIHGGRAVGSAKMAAVQAWNGLMKILLATVGAALAIALITSPLTAVAALGVQRTQKTMESNLADLTDGSAPGITQINDVTGAPIAWLYQQRRITVPSNEIADTVKQAIVSVEDRRFYEHKGVDWQGTFRAMLRNLAKGGVEQGASTIDQQYVKNYLVFVNAQTSDEQAAAVETSIPRKLREMRMASDIDSKLTKDEILTRYLNIVPFGNGAFGIEAAARTYYGIHASELDTLQAATLAGIVQSSSALNPYTNPQGLIERRNTVLDTMVASGVLDQATATALQAEPLGVLDEPQGLPNGCITAGNRGFFCDYVLDYLAKRGLTDQVLAAGAYTIDTTLDPAIQDATFNAVRAQAGPGTQGAANVMNVIAPSPDSRAVQAMVSSRDYGLDLELGQTMLPQPFTLVGSGAGSAFKVFTAAVALDKGMGINTMLSVPARYEARGMGEGGAKNCPPNTYCVENDGVYQPQMTLQDALAHSPNTTFVQLIEKLGVKDVVNMAVKLGLRSYQEPGTFDGESSIADYMIEHNLGSFTLGPTAVNPLELSNVAATIASDGMWCEPNPIVKVTDQDGHEVPLAKTPCERVLPADLAHALGQAMSKDFSVGTAADTARAYGWGGQAAGKTGTTESHMSSAFLGFNNHFAAASYIYNDGTEIAPLCSSPLRQCGDGNLYGGMEAARSWIAAAENIPAAMSGTLPAMNAKFQRGLGVSDIPRVTGMSEKAAREAIEKAGYRVSGTRMVAGNGITRGQVVGTSTDGDILRDGEVTLLISDGTFTPPPTSTATQPAPAPRTNDSLEDLNQAINDLIDALSRNQ